MTEEKPIVHYYNGDDYRFALYVYNDEPETVYLENVFVYKKSRGHGIGNNILTIAEQEVVKMDADILCLKCLKDSWVHNWYKEHGFEDLCLDNNPKFMWMKKDI